MRDMVDRAVNRALGRIRLAFRAVLTAVDSATPVQLVQADGLAGEQLQDNELMQHYGFTSVPQAGAHLVVLPIGGKTAHGIIIATEHLSVRMKGLKGGEVALYDDLGQSVHLTREGIVVDGGGKAITVRNTPNIELDSPLVHTTGKLKVDGDVEIGGSAKVAADLVAQGDVKDHGGKSMAGMRDAYNAHKHGNTPPPDKAM